MDNQRPSGTDVKAGLRSASRRRLLVRTAAAAPATAVAASLGPLADLLPHAAAAGLTDYDYAQFCASLEAAAYKLYQGASGGSVPVDRYAHEHVQAAAAFETFVAVGQAGPDAQSTGGSVGPDPDDPSYAEGLPKRANPKVVDRFAGQVASDAPTGLQSLENALAATYLGVLGKMEDKSGAKTTAQVLAGGGQRATALGVLANQALTDLVPPTQTDRGRLDPSAYPTPRAERTYQPGGSSGGGSSSGGGGS